VLLFQFYFHFDKGYNMEYQSVFQSASRVLHGRNAEKFDPENLLHREAYATWELMGHWPIRFLTEWPFVTVPQTVMAALARHACKKDFENIALDQGIELKPGFDSYFFRRSAK
jgi:hypothetical protein